MATLPNPLPMLAADPSGRALGLELPPGTLVEATDESGRTEPLLWYAQEPARPGDWLRLTPARRTAGLHPVLIGGTNTRGPWPEKWDLCPSLMSYAGDHDAEEVLAELWEEYTDDAEQHAGEDYPGKERVEELFGPPAELDETLAPFGAEWPGLATAGPLSADPDTRAAGVADSLVSEGSWLKQARIALVPARRSADIPAAIGWSGSLNYESDVARLCAVLRSWEDRFGIRVVALTSDQVVVSVAAPPTTTAEAEAVAAEHFAFAPDNVLQGLHTTLRTYAVHDILDNPSWGFWWD